MPLAPSGTALPTAAYSVIWILFAPNLDCYFKQNCACTVICFESDRDDHIFALTVRPRELSQVINAPHSTYRNTACTTNNIKGSLSTFFADIYCFTWNIAQLEQRGRIWTAIGSKIELFNFEQNILPVCLFVIAQPLSSAQPCFGNNAFRPVSKVFRSEADAQLYLTA